MNIAIVRTGNLRRQHHLTTLFSFLLDQGIHIHFISLRCSLDEVQWIQTQLPQMEVSHIPVPSCGMLRRFYMGGVRLRRLLKKINFDILYVIESWTLPYLTVATFGTMRWRNKPSVYHTFDMLVPFVHPKLYLQLERRMMLKASLNINADPSRAAVVKAFYGLDRAPLAVPLRLRKDVVLPKCDAQLRAELLGNKESGFLLVYPTLATKERMTKEIVQTFAYLPEKYHLAAIEGETAYTNECKTLAQQLGVSDRIKFLSPMPYEEILKICACADAGLIFHDINESLGNYLCHPSRLAYYVALGLPVIANDVPILSSLVYRYQLGACCSPEEPEEMANTIRWICESGGACGSLDELKRHIRSQFEKHLYYEREGIKIPDELKKLWRPQN